MACGLIGHAAEYFSLVFQSAKFRLSENVFDRPTTFLTKEVNVVAD